MTEHWVNDGFPDPLSHELTVPSELEVLPGEFRPIGDCSAAELLAAADARRIDAACLIEKAQLLERLATLRAHVEYIDQGRAAVIRHQARWRLDAS